MVNWFPHIINTEYVCNLHGIEPAHRPEKKITFMDTTLVAKDEFQHFSHDHPFSLVKMQPNFKKENDEDEDEDKYKVEFVEDEQHGGECDMCMERIWSFHKSYYYCKACDISLHKFCAELPVMLEKHPLHPDHRLILVYFTDIDSRCFVCNLEMKKMCAYYCMVCENYMRIICATMSEQKIDHHSHPHQLERMFGHILSNCVACGDKHEGVFFQCTTCPRFRIYLECSLLPIKLLIQNHTNGVFTHSHPLALAYSFECSEMRANFDPVCRVCGDRFLVHLWLYKCDICRYYVHVNCATSKREPFMCIFLPPGLDKNYKNFKESEHMNLLNCPFQDEGDNILKRHMSNQKELIGKQDDGEMLNQFIHQHPLILFNKQTSNSKEMVSLHDPMKRVQLLCDGCVKPIMTVQFYTCCQYVGGQCCFFLHEWCAKLPSQVQDYTGHPKHTLFLLPKIPSRFFSVFECDVCQLPSNGFAYGCTTCDYYVDVNCAFIPEEITHEAHPGHLLSKVKTLNTQSSVYCKACFDSAKSMWGFQCSSCKFYIHVGCAMLLPNVIKHKCDKHPLSLRYEPVENHISEYFCEICEYEFNPWQWFYHCTTCAQSMHTACVPLILKCEQATYIWYRKSVYDFLNVKFGGTLEIKSHSTRLAFVQGLLSHGWCFRCYENLQYNIIFKCLKCKFAFHYKCASSFSDDKPTRLIPCGLDQF